MVLEIANIEIKADLEKDFEAAVAKALPHFEEATGFISLNLRRNIENARLYHLCIEWETLEDHTVGFRESGGFQAWRELVSHYFDKPPSVSHSRLVKLAAQT